MAAAPDDHFAFTNLTGRSPGVVTRALGAVLPGVREVHSQIGPYAAAWQAANQRALKGGHRRWIALGDSMTQGIGASDATQGWVPQLARRLPVAVDVINLSQSGARVDDLLEHQLPAWRKLPPAEHGEFVTVLIGSNDVMHPAHRRVLPDSFIELLQALPAGAIIASVPSPAAPAREANRYLAEAARAGRVRAVPTDALGPSAWRGRLAADRFHPNDAGYALIADMFEPFVRRAAAITGLAPLDEQRATP